MIPSMFSCLNFLLTCGTCRAVLGTVWRRITSSVIANARTIHQRIQIHQECFLKILSKEYEYEYKLLFNTTRIIRWMRTALGVFSPMPRFSANIQKHNSNPIVNTPVEEIKYKNILRRAANNIRDHETHSIVGLLPCVPFLGSAAHTLVVDRFAGGVCFVCFLHASSLDE